MKEVDNIKRSTTRVVLAVLAFLGFSAAGAFAEKFGPFTYRVVDGTIDIIDYTGDDTGHVDIPGEIDGKPVTAITGGAGGANGAFVSSGIISVTIPEGVETIGSFAFGICFNLTSVVIPDTVTIIGRPASYQSNAPATCASGNIFDDAVQGFHVYYLNGKNGFDTPQWQPLASSPYTYSAESLGCLLSESQVWQLGHGLPADTDLKPDPSGNEENLLIAYALDLEPNEVIGGNLPRATLVDPDALSISCFAPREDIVYTVETSTDLRSWTTDGVNVSESGAGNRQTAAVGRDLIPRFHRLRASMTSNPDLQRGIRRSNPHFFAFRSGPTADSEAIRQNQISNSYYVCA